MNNDSNVRMIVAVALSLMFLIPYMYFFSPQKSNLDTTNSITTKDLKSTNEAPKTNQNNPVNQTNTMDNKIIATIQSSEFDVNIDDLGRIDSVYLKGEKWKNENGEPLNLINKDGAKPLEIRFSNNEINNKAFNTQYRANKRIINVDSNEKLVLTQDLGDVVVEKTLIFEKNLQYSLEVNMNKTMDYFLSNGVRPIADNSSYVFKGVIVKKSDNKLEKIEDGSKAANLSFNDAKFVSSVDRYYATLLTSNDPLNVIVNDENKNTTPFISLNNNAKFIGYIGPKDHRILKSISPELVDTIEYGIITFFAKPLFLLLDYLNTIFKNWGWAIIGLTLIVRIVLYPLTYKGMVSMQRLKELAPKLKEIQTKYKGDTLKLQTHMMDLYKKHKVNPMGGCLPLILQIPVFFAIYRVLYNAVELKDAPWIFWIKDLSALDPYFILPILMGGSMYLQQHLTPTTFSDPTQEKIFKFLPLVFTIFLITFPSGLILYWTVNNIFSIIQQLIINKVMQKNNLNKR